MIETNVLKEVSFRCGLPEVNTSAKEHPPKLDMACTGNYLPYNTSAGNCAL